MPFVHIGDLKTHYALTGNRDPVLVFSNSLGTDFSMWDSQMEELERRFCILVMTLAGMGSLQ